MAASIQINGVTQQVAVVPFGVAVSLTNAAAVGTSQKWEILDYSRDLDDAGPDFATNFTAWTLSGDGSYFINQTPAFTGVSFKPDVTGAYWIRLTSVEPGGSVIQTAVVRVVEAHTGESLAAAGETTESGAREGWKKIINGRMKRLGKRMQGYVRVANVTGASIARGKVVRLVGTTDAHLVPPNVNPGGTAAAKAEKIFTIVVADNTVSDAQAGDYAILDATLGNNGTGWAQKFGLFEGKADVDYTGYTAQTPVYFDSTGTQRNTPAATGKSISIGVVLDVGSSGTISVRQSDIVRNPDGTLSTPFSADWPMATKRRYAVDYDLGIDTNIGYSDVSASAAFAAPIKTLTRLFQILPQTGAGRKVWIGIKKRAAGAVYRNPGDTADDDVVLNQVGYRRIEFHATTDGSDDTIDRRLLGCQTVAAGPGPGGVWTCDVGGTTATFAISTGTLPAEFTTATGYRVRFLGNITAGLANISAGVHTHTTSSITTMEDLPFAPATGDQFLIEQPGVAVGNVYIGQVSAGVDSESSVSNSCVVAGVRTTGTTGFRLAGSNTTVHLTFCEAAGASVGFNANDMTCLEIDDTMPLSDGTVVTRLGFGLKSLGANVAQDIGRLDLINSCAGGISPFLGVRSGTIYRSSVIPSGAVFTGCGVAAFAGLNALPNYPELHFGSAPSNATQRRARYTGLGGGYISINSCTMSIGGLDLTGSTVAGALNFTGSASRIRVEDVVGSSGNTGSGINIAQLEANSHDTLIAIAPTVTVSGAAGDIAGWGGNTSYASLILTGFTDNLNNRILSINVFGIPQGFATSLSGAAAVGNIMRSTGSTYQVTKAQADTAAHATAVVGVSLTSPTVGNAITCFAAPFLWVRMDSAATVGNICYLSEVNAGQGKSVPPTPNGVNVILRLGTIIGAGTVSSVNYALVVWNTEKLPIVSDGGL